MTILYEDKYLVVAVKPVGVLSEDDPKAACMPALLREHYRTQGEKDDIATVHRLDRVTGGVMVFSRRKEITGKLTAAVAAHEITKEYLAVLRGHPEKDADTLTDLLSATPPITRAMWCSGCARACGRPHWTIPRWKPLTD